MTPRTFARLLLLVPFAVIAVIMAPILVNAGRAGSMSAGEFVRYGLPVLVSFGVPQYAVFALGLAIATRRMNAGQIRRLALWAPVLFVPVLVAPMAVAQHSLADVLSVVAMMGAIGLAVGYVCVGIALVLWPLCVREESPRA